MSLPLLSTQHSPERQPSVALGRRRLAVGWAAGVVMAGVLAAAACADRPRVATDDRTQLAAGVRTADSLAVAPQLDDAGVIALGYFERLRLGLGSPFRLAEQAASDARMPGSLGRQVAWAVLARTAQGQAFALDPEALGEDPAPGFGTLTNGAWHRATIDSVVGSAATARTGEQTVQVGYALARAEGLVSANTANAAVHAAAMARDRRLATEDAGRLLAAARAQETYDALDLVPVWRDARRLRVETPLMADALAPDADAAVRQAEHLLASMRQTSVSILQLTGDSAGTALESAGGLSLDAARRLAGLPSVRGAYPLSPVVVTLGGYRQTEVADSLDDERTPATERKVRLRFIARATTDERLAAEWAVARAALPGGTAARRELTALVQAAAVAVRPWAQAPVDAGVAVEEQTIAAEQGEALRLRDGLRAIVFESGTPARWRSAAARQLGNAVADLRGVFPELTLDGLTVRVAESPRRGLALALHEPRSRTVYLPPSTSAGTVAHELVHDLDAQAAATHLALHGVYGTDRLTRTGGSGHLARAVRALAATAPTAGSRDALGATPPTALAFDANRPAERLARGADFFVAAALAREGRSNGVLSAVQDGVLTGFAGVTAPEPGDGAAEALVSVLDEVTLVPAATRQWYLARFGSQGVRSPLAVAQFALMAQPAWDGERTLRASGLPIGLASGAPDGRSGRSGLQATCGGIGGGAGAPWQARLLWLTADARARGYVRARAAHSAAVGGTWWGWSARGILGGPWRPDLAESGVARTRDALLRAALGAARRASGACGLVTP